MASAVAEVPADPAESPLRDEALIKRDEITAWVGMVCFLASWGMMFGALFFTYGGIRARAVAWPPEGLPAIPLYWPAINTVIIFLSSLTLQASIWTIRKADYVKTNLALWTTLILGVVFLALQFKVWGDLQVMGLLPSSGFYGSVFYGLTWIHAAHVLVGLLALLWLCVFALKGQYSAARHITLRLWTMYWHFVGVIWAMVFVTVYLV
jgi:cytochrome c oxidase subunit 3